MKNNNVIKKTKYEVILYLIKVTTIYFLCLCCTSEQGNENDLILFDVKASYPEKEIQIEDVANIEYLQLEVNEEFLFNDVPTIITTDKIIIGQRSTGEILVFSREGKPLSKFNRQGNGPEDYPAIRQLIYNETSDELFVLLPNKIIVYSILGEFRRSIPFLKETNINSIVSFDAKTLLLYDGNNKYPSPFTFISKADGSVIETVDTPRDKNIITYIVKQEINNNVLASMTVLFAPAYHFVRYNDGYLLTDFAIDTVYFLSRAKELSPILARKPAIQSMDPVVYLNSFINVSNYEFVSAVTVKNENNQLPRTYLMRDKKTGSVYRQKITLNDYKGRQVTLSPETIENTQDSKLGLIVLALVELQAANSENKLSGRLKELVDNSDEDGNDIYMLLHFK